MLYISLHRYGERWYPESGALGDVGEGEATGFNVNIPWPQVALGVRCKM